ncbi:MAG: hypothetical protein PHI27_06405 [Eubacteriales bacterium]|nr:hypothetical protein [Eubacteriales bacterium]MDD3881866.1 hypothetical protein [Eubacteriales bacterium]MDD4512889.1 hypothetical protein [Eubacteriales bacterium]
MQIDTSLAREIAQWTANDGTRKDICRVKAALRDVRDMMSTTDAPQMFSDGIKRFGRAAVAVGVACTIVARRESLNARPIRWALAVLSACKVTFEPDTYAWRDGLHPSKIEVYAGAFIRATTVE